MVLVKMRVGRLMRLTLELYCEAAEDRELAEDMRARFLRLVRELAPHLNVVVLVRDATSIIPKEWHQAPKGTIPNQPPSKLGRQALLITSEEIGAKGWAGVPQGCLSKQALVRKRRAGAEPADIVIHEWIHTLCGIVINGRPVPFADHAETMGFRRDGVDAEGDDLWHTWYKYALGGVRA